MVRSFSSSRISVHSGKQYRQRAYTVGNAQRNNRPITRRTNSNDNKDMFEVFDVCDRSPDSNKYYRVRWKGYPERKYDTYEPADHLKAVGLENKLKEIDQYVEWREKYMQENPDANRAPSIYVYRKKQGKPTYAANEDFTCVIVALNIMNTLLGINFLFDSTLMYKFGGKGGFKYSKLRRMVSHQQKILKRNFLSLEGIKHNRTKGCYNNTKILMINLSKEQGIFFCGAGNTLGLHHTFVLMVRETKVYIFDDAFGWENKPVSTTDLCWITSWRFVLKGVKRELI